MQSQNPILDQLSKVVTEAAGAADGVRREAETVVRSQIQRYLADADLVPREEFEVLKDRVEALQMAYDNLKAKHEETEKA